jgi:hypothetical protein
MPLFLLIMFLPVATVQRLLLTHTVPEMVGVFNLGFPIAVMLALGGSMVVLDRYLSAEAAGMQPETAGSQHGV